MLSRGRFSQIKTAFKNVYGVDDIDEQELVRAGTDIIFHAREYPFESGELTSFRFSTINDISESDAILEYLSKVPDSEFSGTQMSTYGKLFELGKKYGIGYQGKPAEDSTPVVTPEAIPEPNPTVSNSVPEVAEEAGYNTGMERSGSVTHEANPAALAPEAVEDTEAINTTNIFKEEMKTMDPIKKMQDEAQALGAGVALQSNIAEVSKNDKDAAAAVVEASQSDRINYSKNSKITKVLVTAIDREKKAIEGRASMGKVSKPTKALETFIAKTGCTIEDGVVKFSRLHATETHDNALKVLQVLQSAVADENVAVQPYFGKEGTAVPVSIKGVVIDDPGNKEITLPQREIPVHILNNAFLYLDVASKTGAQFQLDTATAKGGTAPKKSYVVRVANKAELLEDNTVCVYIKKITDKPSESKTGYKSALSVSCNSSKPSAGEPKKVSWRIPLEVEQYEVEIVDQYADLFKTGVGNQTKPISVNNDADIRSIVQKITLLVAQETSKSSSDSIVNADTLAAVNSEKAKIVAAGAAAVNDTLGMGASADEFEG